MTTPLKRSPSGFDISPYAAKLPRFEKVGSYAEDEENCNSWTQLKQMISGCQADPKLVPILYGKFSEAVENLSKHSGWQAAELFHPVPKNLGSLPQDFVFAVVQRHSGLKADDLVAVQRVDPKGAVKLYCALTQLPMTLRIEGNLLCRGFMDNLSTLRAKECGDMLKTVKKNGFVSGGQIYWANCGSYEPRFNGGKLVNVTHLASKDTVDVDPTEMLVSSSWQLVDNWSDTTANFQYKGQPGLKLAGLFAREPPAGPWRYKHFSGSKQQNFQDWVEESLKSYLEERQKVSGKSEEETEIEQKVKELSEEKKQKAMEGAKAAAKAALAKAKGLRNAKTAPKAAAKKSG